MVQMWKSMWSNEDRAERETVTPWVMGVIALSAILAGGLMSFNYI